MSDKKMSLVLAGAAAVFVAVSLFLGLPAIVYDSNPGEFDVPFRNIIATYLPWAAALIVLMLLPALVLPRGLARVWAALMAVLAIYVWAHGVFQTHIFGAMDGQNWSAAVPARHIYIEAVVIALAAVLLFSLAYRAQKLVAIVSLALAAGLLVQAWPLASKSNWIAVTDEVEMPRVANFSRDKNALVVLMDTMASDVFEEVVKANPAIENALDGFILYPDTLGASPSTYLAMPTIHSGRVYKKGKPLSEYFQDAVKNNSILTKVAAAGYRTTLVNTIQRVCPANVDCLKAEAAIRSNKAVVRSESIRILDAILFRLAPLGLKNDVYNNGEWIIHRKTEDERLLQRAMMHNYFLGELAAAVSVQSDVPTLKFLHLMNTHPPYIHTATCAYGGKTLENTRENFAIQIRCSLESLVILLDALKTHQLYDRTAIILLADHGNGAVESTRTSLSAGEAKLVGAANPTFAIKPMGAKGPFKTAGGEIYLGDFGATLCDLLKACTADSGISALREPTGRVRIFNYYKWKHEFWRAATIKGLVPYEIRGPLGASENWVRETPIRIGQRVDFSDKGETRLAWNGWSAPEAWGTWADGDTATLAMTPDRIEPLRLVLEGQGFVAGKPVRVTTSINNKPVGEMVFDRTSPSGQFTFDVPEEALKEGAIRVEFLISDPKSPMELGISQDTRKLGFGLISLKLEPRAP